ncbi:LysR family transcriptional regulator [Nioella aestuarii]|uniref:LysR family transcriptional regulator n=1 Tax=Nioella aestuarii TaxID=1662864 RepID=UPI003D7F8635
MNIAAIQTFLAVVRCRNLNRAAEQLNVTQSAVTARLDTLEQALGAQLLVRSRKGATLTKAGFAFLEQAEVIARTWENARARANLPRGVTRLFSFVCDPGLWPELGQRWIDEIRAAHPETAIEIWSGLLRDAETWLQSGMSDAALLSEPVIGAGLEHREFASDRLILVTSSPDLMWQKQYIYVDYGPLFRAQHAEAWPTDETAALAFSNPDWALDHMRRDGGAAYLPVRIVQGDMDRGCLHPVPGALSFDRRIVLSWRKASAESFSFLAPSDPAVPAGR